MYEGLESRINAVPKDNGICLSVTILSKFKSDGKLFNFGMLKVQLGFDLNCPVDEGSYVTKSRRCWMLVISHGLIFLVATLACWFQVQCNASHVHWCLGVMMHSVHRIDM